MLQEREHTVLASSAAVLLYSFAPSLRRRKHHLHTCSVTQSASACVVQKIIKFLKEVADSLKQSASTLLFVLGRCFQGRNSASILRVARCSWDKGVRRRDQTKDG